MSNTHLNVLIQLAKIDGEVVKQELDYIYEVGKANGYTADDVNEMFDNDEPIGDLQNLSDDLKYELIFSVVQLMKIDGKLYNEEIQYCARTASKLGYDEKVLFELMLKIYADPDMCADKEELKQHIQNFLLS